MEIPQKFQNQEFISRVFSWAKAALRNSGFEASAYGTDLNAASNDIVQMTFSTILEKSDDYPLQLAETRARSEAEDLTETHFGDEPASIDPQLWDAKVEEFFQELYTARVRDLGTDDWWRRFIRQTINNHVRNLQRSYARPVKAFGQQVGHASAPGMIDIPDSDIFENISEVKTASSPLPPPVQFASGLEELERDEFWHEVEDACRRVVRNRSGGEDPEKETAFIEIMRRVYFENESEREAFRAVCPDKVPFAYQTANRLHLDLKDELYAVWNRRNPL